ncbi:phage shock protein PspC (stress-responsive transcriptional regulator) [Sphingomonas sp. BE138]|uniref:PspC domain-containing protein n=1 Tax=Sphingomonas sp. BE138 TaxID=2817845 RepID=UPI0028592CE8|nr:PspC domain-containing protein [Sphingomonas sp. BE138]MDR6789473.1 phage shock protein PspC (stress-responsive transcriptional regulator) [Sphingomonas sp. BE138]
MTDTNTPQAPRDNLFGICAALGEDFGFNPMWLRLAFAVALLFSLEKVLLTYAALGVLVVVSRLLFPNRKPAKVAVADAPAASDTIVEQEYRKAA